MKEYRWVLVHNHDGDIWGVCREKVKGARQRFDNGPYHSIREAQSEGYDYLEFVLGRDTNLNQHWIETEVRDVTDWRDTDWEDEN